MKRRYNEQQRKIAAGIAAIKSNARKGLRTFLQWMKAAGVVLKNIKVTEGKLPLTVYEQLDSFIERLRLDSSKPL